MNSLLSNSITVAATLLWIIPAHGASIDWGPVLSTTSSAANDVVDGGEVVLAINGRSQPDSSSRRPPSSVTLDGIEFESVAIRDFLGRQAIDVQRALSLIRSTGDADYDAFLTHVGWVNVINAGLAGTDSHAIYPIRGLDVDTEYFIQLWYTDERPSAYADARSRVSIYGDNEPAENLVSVPGEGDNGFGSFVVGSFTADGRTQALSLRVANASRSHLTGILVREAPACTPGTGDFNNDGFVEFDDFLVLSKHFGLKVGPGLGDIDCNRSVDFTDFLFLSRNFGRSVEGAATAVPEANSQLLAIIAFVSLMGLCPRRSRH